MISNFMKPCAIVLLTISSVFPDGVLMRSGTAKTKTRWDNTAYLLIDIQNDYFRGGTMELLGPDKAGNQAKKLLKYFRNNNVAVLHVRHENLNPGATFFLPNSHGAEIHTLVSPKNGEIVIIKHRPDSFSETTLEYELKKINIKRLVISGMQSNVCVKATTLEALNRSYEVIVAVDAITAKNIVLHEAAVKDMTDAGAKIVTSATLME